ncbi:MAG TPA: hypothetical protein VG146_02325 [Verrucomicrobiae bacterium]|nr:hypothetical protein [Verrucomicrobiae bacterium]
MAAWLVISAGALVAQQAPHLAYVYPAGGRVGTTFQVVVGGQFLAAISNAVISDTGIRATFLEFNRPMNQKEFNDLRERLQTLQRKWQSARRDDSGTNAWTAADAKEREQIREKILKNPPNRAANPAMIDTVTLQFVIETNAALGEHEIRLAAPNAVSNPLWFFVGTLPETTKPASKAANPDLDRFLERFGKTPVKGTPKYEGAISLPVTVNGQIMPGEVDRYRFSARRGQHLIFSAAARALIPYLADAVPGWFEATLTLYDSTGKEVASAERFRFKPDPVLHFEVPSDGEYTVEIHDSIFRGREDFVYRLSIGELPFVTDIFPLGGRAGETNTVSLSGWNLPTQSLTMDNSANPPGFILIAGDFLKRVPFVLDDLPECLSQENSSETAQPMTLPVVIDGRISRPGQTALFKFEGRAGQQIVAEVLARRLNSPLDSALELTDAAGKRLAFNDDFEDKSFGLETHHADSYIKATLPAEGNYFLRLSDVQDQGGPAFAYRLRVSEPRPDFALRVTPSSLTVRAGMSVPVTVYALRKDGFTNAIELHLQDAPQGFSLAGARVPENQDKAQFTLKATPQSRTGITNLVLEGQSAVAGRSIVHEAVPADERMQAFAYWHLVPAQELAVCVAANPRPFASDALRILSATPVRIPSGGMARVHIGAPSPAFASRFDLELVGAPEGLAIQEVSPAANGVEIAFVSDSAKTKPGAKGNLIINIIPKNARLIPAAAKQNRKRNPVGTLPAIPFIIISSS